MSWDKLVDRAVGPDRLRVRVSLRRREFLEINTAVLMGISLFNFSINFQYFQIIFGAKNNYLSRPFVCDYCMLRVLYILAFFDCANPHTVHTVG